MPNEASYNTHVWHLFVIRTKARDTLQQYLYDNGIDTVIHYPIPIHKQGAYNEYNDLILPNAEELGNTVLSLPLFYGMTDDEINYVIDKINSYDSNKCLSRKK